MTLRNAGAKHVLIGVDIIILICFTQIFIEERDPFWPASGLLVVLA